jgi:two-component system chemotaxis response regulator CheY
MPLPIRAAEPRPTAVVVDDSLTTRMTLRRALEQAGYQVVAEGASGVAALALYERHRPDLMTLDIILPMLDGVTAAVSLLGRHPDAVIVMCSSLDHREKILTCRDAGVTHFLLKPFSGERVVALARAIAQRKGPGAAARATGS